MEGMKEGDVVIVYQNLSHSLELLFLNVIVILMCRKVDLKGPKILQLQVQCYTQWHYFSIHIPAFEKWLIPLKVAAPTFKYQYTSDAYISELEWYINYKMCES